MIKFKIDAQALANARKRRAIFFYIGLSIFLMVLGSTLLYLLRTLLLPSILGLILAYLVKPVLTRWRLKWLPENLRLPFILTTATCCLFLLVIKSIQHFPGERELLTLQTRLQYRLNEKHLTLLLAEKKGEVGFLMKSFRTELEPVLAKANDLLTFDEEQHQAYRNLMAKNDSLALKYKEIYLSNIKGKAILSEKNELSSYGQTPKSHGPSFISQLLKAGSHWLVLPIVFFFLLFDKGQLLHFLFKFVPNRYFELSMTILEEVDLAIGAFLRGTLIESMIVGVILSLGFFLVGINLQMAVLIGMVSGIANAIPFVGPMFGLVLGLIYSLIAENLSPHLPFLQVDQIYLGVIAVVAIAHIIDNAVLQPLVLGGAVNLHPLVVILAVLGGSVLMGMMGMLFAIPTVVVVKVVIETLVKELRAYRII